MNVEDEIRRHFGVGAEKEWLVEKGKETEARLLKKAVARIESLKTSEAQAWNHYDKAQEVINKNCREARAELEAERDLLAAKRGVIDAALPRVQKQLKSTLTAIEKALSERQ